MDEKEIVEKYSTPGLRSNELTRWGKRQQLEQMPRMSKAEIEEILDKLYGKGGK